MGYIASGGPDSPPGRGITGPESGTGIPRTGSHPYRQSVHRNVVFVIIAAALFMLSLDGTIVATALHTMQTDLETSTVWIGWTITAYSLGLVLILPLAGTLSDHYGRRRVFIASVGMFTAASLACSLATNIQTLIVLRFLQAAGGAGFTPSATGIIVEHFGERRDKAVGLFGSIFPIGTLIGPLLGGLFVAHASWRLIFVVNVPIGLAIIPLALHFIPPDRSGPVQQRLHLDLRGLVVLGAVLTTGMGGLSLLGSTSYARPWGSVGLLTFTAVAMVLFAVHIRRAANPIIAPRLLWGRGFGAVNGINIVCGGAVAGLIALVPFYATTRYGIDALGAGLLLVGEAAVVVITSLAASMLIRRTGYRRPITVGTIIAAVGLAGLSLTPAGMGPHTWLALFAAVIGAGVGWLGPASRNAGLQLAPDLAASIAAMRSLSRQIGLIASVSITTAIISAAAQPATAQSWVYALFPVLLVAALLIVRRVPEHRGVW